MPAALLHKLKAYGIEPYLAANGELRFKAPWPPTAVPTEVKPLLVEAKRIRHLLAAFLRKPDRHPLCGHAEVWLSRHGMWCCLTCHPPPLGVAVWPEEASPSREEPEQPAASPAGVRDLWPYPAIPREVDLLDYRFNPATEEWEYRPGWWRELH